MDRLQVVEGEAIDYLLSAEGTGINKASLSNIFEYTGHPQFNSAMDRLSQREESLRIVYWNLLQDQRVSDSLSSEMQVHETRDNSCFYFGKVYTLEMAAQASLKTSI